MSVTVRKDRRGRFEVDIRFLFPDGSPFRERRLAPVSSKSAARRWGEAREFELLRRGPKKPKREVPRLADFADRFLKGYAEANRQKPSGIASKETILRVHLVPLLGNKRLNEITNEDVQRIKTKLRNRSPKTVNNVLTVLGKLLKVAVEWNVIDRMPCTIRFVRTVKPEVSFLDFPEYDRLIEAAKSMENNALLVILLAGDAGLRCGEALALEWTDLDLEKRQMIVSRSDVKGDVNTTKGGRSRVIPLTVRLTAALKASRHVRGPRVLCLEDGSPLTLKRVENLVWNAARRANVADVGPHRLRHTFCSHLAMRGAPARAIQELAGHKDLSTTQRYMHLSPRAIEDAIRLLEGPSPAPNFGGFLEAAGSED